jgi:hypothetical protein
VNEYPFLGLRPTVHLGLVVAVVRRSLDHPHLLRIRGEEVAAAVAEVRPRYPEEGAAAAEEDHSRPCSLEEGEEEGEGEVHPHPCALAEVEEVVEEEEVHPHPCSLEAEAEEGVRAV